MTFSEAEQLALKLQELIERREALRKILGSALARALSEEERADIRKVLDYVETEKALLEQQLAELLSRKP